MLHVHRNCFINRPYASNSIITVTTTKFPGEISTGFVPVKDTVTFTFNHVTCVTWSRSIWRWSIISVIIHVHIRWNISWNCWSIWIVWRGISWGIHGCCITHTFLPTSFLSSWIKKSKINTTDSIFWYYTVNINMVSSIILQCQNNIYNILSNIKMFLYV